jgi:hypothetical protein
MTVKTAATVGSSRDLPARPPSVLSRLPAWIRFPAFMAGVMAFIVCICAPFNLGVIGFLVPGLFVCGMVALANLAAQKFGITATKR